MAARKSTRLGGEYYIKPEFLSDPVYVLHLKRTYGAEWIGAPRLAARRYFLTAIEDEAPQVLESLYSDVFPLYPTDWQNRNRFHQEIGSMCSDEADSWYDYPIMDREQAEQELKVRCIDNALKYHQAGRLSTDYGNALVRWLKHWNLTED